MTTAQKLFNLHTIIAAVVAAVLMYVFVTSIQNNRLYELELLTRAQIAEQETTLAAIAEITARNGADKVTEAVVRDCTIDERTTFENLLNSLDQGLNRSQLIELERLFGRCGQFYSERKSVMVARLEREIEVYELLIKQTSTITGSDVGEQYQLSGWQSLAELEIKQSELFSELVSLQDSIISNLLNQTDNPSVSLSEIQTKAKEVQDSLLVASKQASSVRAALLEV